MEQDKNSSDLISPELEALTTVVRALQPLSPPIRERVINSALMLLGGSPSFAAPQPRIQPVISTTGAVQEPRGTIDQPEGRAITDIRTLKEDKQPRTATEMATLVAYYLAEIAPVGEGKDKIGSADITKYFKQANFKLPANAKMTLVHSKNAGYLDALGSGDYQLNPVGYNLVTHNLPGKATTPGTQKKQKKGPGKAKKASPRRGKKKS